MTMNYVTLGPVSVRISRKHLAPWGYALLRVGGFSFWSRDSGGGRMLASYHRRDSLTWRWVVTIEWRKERRLSCRWLPSPSPRMCQWHDYLELPFVTIIIGRQDYMERLLRPDSRGGKE